MSEKLFGKATNIRTENDTIIIRLYETDIVKFNAQTITLNTGGWDTKTTKEKMNVASASFNLGFNVYSKKGTWWVSFKGKEIPYDKDPLTLNR